MGPKGGHWITPGTGVKVTVSYQWVLGTRSRSQAKALGTLKSHLSSPKDYEESLKKSVKPFPLAQNFNRNTADFVQQAHGITGRISGQ